MHPLEYANLAAHQDSFWWWAAKQQFVRQSLQQYGPAPDAGLRILDLGCGPGATLTRHQWLLGQVLGLDFAVEALNFAVLQHRGRLMQGNALRLPLATNSLDVVTALDVLYHRWIPNESQVVAEVYRVLKPGGLFIVTNPAFNALRGPHDEVNLTDRRYTLSQAQAPFRQTGFIIRQATCLYALFFPAVILFRLWRRSFFPRAAPTSDLVTVPALINTLMLKLTAIERFWLKYGTFPWGTSVMVTAQKPTR